MDDNDWDLMAVVRSCNKGKAKMPSSSSKDESTQFFFPMFPPPSPPLQFPMPMDFPHLSAKSQSVYGRGDLEAIVMPFLSHQQQQHRQPRPLTPKPLPKPLSAAAAARKKRKKQQKKVVTKVPAESSNSYDNWAWRKYGQKPIKGSPYPRGYYRCSTSKNCPARKQVEKSWDDQGTFIITYTDEHNHALPTHRNSLAGTTRSRLPPSNNGGSNQLRSNSGLSPTTPLTTSPSTEEEEEEDEDEDEGGMLQVEDMQIAGEDELVFLGGDASTNNGCKMVFDAAFFDVDGAYL